MSKKDYQAIAAALNRYRFECEGRMGGSEMIALVDAIASDLAVVMARDNPRFDRDRFIQACETGSCRGMKARS